MTDIIKKKEKKLMKVIGHHIRMNEYFLLKTIE
jgi:hypothetical protein